MTSTRVFNFLAATTLLVGINAQACEFCSLYSTSELSGVRSGEISVGVSEEIISYRKTPRGERSSKKDTEFLQDFSSTQLGIGYDISNSFSLQLAIPLLYRDFDQFHNYRGSNESESGIGDMSALLSYAPVQIREAEQTLIWTVLAGVKAPTGDTGDLHRSGVEEVHGHKFVGKHHPAFGGTDGSALSLGSGSWDTVLGTALFARQGRSFLRGSIQYALRTEGDFNYRFADVLAFDIGPGYFLYADHGLSGGVRFTLSGEYKGRDVFEGGKVNASQMRDLYVGPEVVVIMDRGLFINVGVDIPTSTVGNEALLVPELRVRAAVTYRF